MRTLTRILLGLVLAVSIQGCFTEPTSDPKPLTPEEEKKLEENIKNAQESEGGQVN